MVVNARAAQLLNTRPTRTRLYSGSRVHSNDSAWRLPRDPIDEALYAFVRLRFEEDLRRHRIRKSCCPIYNDISQVPDDVSSEPHREYG